MTRPPTRDAGRAVAATCECGRRIRVAKTTLAEAPILCSRCAQPFHPDDQDN